MIYSKFNSIWIVYFKFLLWCVKHIGDTLYSLELEIKKAHFNWVLKNIHKKSLNQKFLDIFLHKKMTYKALVRIVVCYCLLWAWYFTCNIRRLNLWILCKSLSTNWSTLRVHIVEKNLALIFVIVTTSIFGVKMTVHMGAFRIYHIWPHLKPFS